MISCDDVRAFLDLDNDTLGVTRKDFEQHILVCNSCRQFKEKQEQEALALEFQNIRDIIEGLENSNLRKRFSISQEISDAIIRDLQAILNSESSGNCCQVMDKAVDIITSHLPEVSRFATLFFLGMPALWRREFIESN